MNRINYTRVFLTIAIFPLFNFFSYGQINESDTTKIQFRLAFNGNVQKGNLELNIWRGNLDFLWTLDEAFVLKTQNNVLYQEFSGRKSDEDLFSKNYLYFKPKSKVYPYAIGFVSTNFRRKINFRYFTGLGITWQMINSKKNVLKLSTNVIYESSYFSKDLFNFTEFNGNSRIQLWRNSLYLSGIHYLLDRHFRLFYEIYWQPELSRNVNYRAQWIFGLDFPIWKGLNGNISHTYTFENVVAEKVLQKDSILLFGFSYQLKKL